MPLSISYPMVLLGIFLSSCLALHCILFSGEEGSTYSIALFRLLHVTFLVLISDTPVVSIKPFSFSFPLNFLLSENYGVMYVYTGGF